MSTNRATGIANACSHDYWISIAPTWRLFKARDDDVCFRHTLLFSVCVSHTPFSFPTLLRVFLSLPLRAVLRCSPWRDWDALACSNNSTATCPPMASLTRSGGIWPIFHSALLPWRGPWHGLASRTRPWRGPLVLPQETWRRRP